MIHDNSIILEGNGLSRTFQVSAASGRKTVLTAVDNVSLTLYQGETLGIAGESGCGKSTLAKIMSGLTTPDAGTVFYKGNRIDSLNSADTNAFRRLTQMIFQDPFSSLNPRMRVGDSIAEPLELAGCDRQQRQETLARILDTVGLPFEAAQRFPDEFSGGQRQRIGIARALAASPEILIADEPVSSLDISIQAQILNLLLEMKKRYNLSMLLVSHNLSVLRHMCDRVIIMYLGTIVESAPADLLFSQCRHPYTEALLAAVPSTTPGKGSPAPILADDLPSPLALPPGCRFHPRCRHAKQICSRQAPLLSETVTGHFSACHFSDSIFPAGRAASTD